MQAIMRSQGDYGIIVQGGPILLLTFGYYFLLTFSFLTTFCCIKPTFLSSCFKYQGLFIRGYESPINIISVSLGLVLLIISFPSWIHNILKLAYFLFNFTWSTIKVYFPIWDSRTKYMHATIVMVADDTIISSMPN